MMRKGMLANCSVSSSNFTLHILLCILPQFHRSQLWVSENTLLYTNRFRNQPLCFSHNVWVNICRRAQHSTTTTFGCGPKEMSQPLPRLLWHGTTTHHCNAAIAIENSKDSVNWVVALIHNPPQQSNSVAGKIIKNHMMWHHNQPSRRVHCILCLRTTCVHDPS